MYTGSKACTTINFESTKDFLQDIKTALQNPSVSKFTAVFCCKFF